MPTYGDVFLGDFRGLLTQLAQLTHKAYDEQDVRDLVSKIGTKTELFLKATAFPVKDPRNNFYSFIDELASVGIDQTHIGWFHDLRKLYNDAKHDPNAQVTLLMATETIGKAEKTANLIVGNSIGNSSQTIRSNSNRVYWIAAWDHYTSGDTEIHILIPGESGHWLGPPTFDMINIKVLEWDDVKFKLSVAGKLSNPVGLIPQNQLDLFKDDDFLAAFVWEGEYRVLLNVLAQHELRQKLITGLNRQDTGHYMQIAVLMAMLDVIGASYSIDDLATNIQSQAIASYGVPPEYTHMEYFIEGLKSLAEKIDINQWPNIHGPKWLSEEQWGSEENPIALHANGYIMIDSNFTLAMKWEM